MMKERFKFPRGVKVGTRIRLLSPNGSAVGVKLTEDSEPIYLGHGDTGVVTDLNPDVIDIVDGERHHIDAWASVRWDKPPHDFNRCICAGNFGTRWEIV